MKELHIQTDMPGGLQIEFDNGGGLHIVNENGERILWDLTQADMDVEIVRVFIKSRSKI